METSLVRDVQILSTGVLGAFAVLHFILYLQQRSTLSNLVFAGALVFAAVATFLDFETNFVAQADEFTLLRFQRVTSMIWAVLLYILVLVFFDQPFGRESRILVAMAVAVGILLFLRPLRLLPLGHAGSLVFVVLIARNTATAVRQGLPNAKTIAVGLGFLFVSMLYDLSLDMLFTNASPLISNGYPFGIMAFLVATSWALGRDTAAVHRRLAREAQARALSEAELAHRQADIDDAKKLQQSFLPSGPPAVSSLDVAFAQQMTMEVGGDYYDFHELDGDTLLLAVGDATGHGTRGGLMVAVVKSLFQTADTSAPPEEILRQASRVIKQMGLQSMFMGLSVARFEPGHVHIACAGMPPVLIRRAADGRVDRIVQKTMPLGAFRDFPYERSTVRLEPADTVLMLSDGLVECFNPDRELLGIERIAESLRQQQNATASRVIDAILELADEWRMGTPFEDDVTIAAVRVLD